MALTAVKVLELIKKYNLIENLSDRELNNPEGIRIDIRIGEIYEIIEPGFLGITERHTPKVKKLASVNDGDKEFTIKPGEYFLIKTMEKFNIPKEKIEIEPGNFKYLTPIITPRTSLQRCGIALFRGGTDPGYSGEPIFGIANLGKFDFKFELGARMFNVLFEEVVGDIKRGYSGQHQGGRVSGGVTETQN